ncbi:unnamed protein product [Microthlaspi erraticum]|uniref:Uncharacterized protein n=1 Tax=Microthlaspi erraticum TaxID=1685480 RepID=A0A6D2KIX9_9BRAS|nr:unnamed protein product [Microthlaspi erraticum]CAA7052972.1 unnamed protein product [Microthlaspi erraticum]
MSAQVIRTPMPLTSEQLVGITNRVKDESDKCFDAKEEYILRQMVTLAKKHIVCDDGLRYVLKAVDLSNWIMEAALVRKVINRVIVPSLWREEEDEALFKHDFKRFLIQDRDDLSRRGLARQIFRGIVYQGDEVVQSISYQEIQLLLRMRSLWNWQKFECGIDLAVCWLECGMHIDIDGFLKEAYHHRRSLGTAQQPE